LVKDNIKGPVWVEVKVPNETENVFPDRLYAFWGEIVDGSGGRPVAGECGGSRALVTSVMSFEKPSDCSCRMLNLYCL